MLVKLYFDEYAGLREVDDRAIVVADVQSYAAARQAIEALKSGESAGPLIIIVRSRHFVMGFHDLTLLGDLVQITRIAPRDEIARVFHLQVPSQLTDRDLFTLGIESPADLLAVAGPQGIQDLASFDDALLAKAFGSQVFQASDLSSFENWFQGFLAFLYSGESSTKLGWRVEYVRRLVEERTKTILDQFGKKDLLPVVTNFLRGSETGEVQTYLNQLATRYWLSSYPKLARKAVVDNMTEQVGRWHELKRETVVLDALAPWCETLYGQIENPLIERLEQVLTVLLDQGDLIEENDLGRYIKQTSGRFAAEYEAVQARLGNRLLEQYSAGAARELRTTLSTHLAQLDSHFRPFFQRTGQSAQKAVWIDPLLEFSDVISHLDEAAPSQWTDWLAVYELLIKAKHLKREVHSALPVPYAEPLADLNTLFAMLDERLNSQFADWLLEKYPRLVTCISDRPLLVMNAARLALDSVARGGRVILLVLDALDWELWRHLRTAFGKHGFVVQGAEAGLAMLPTITEFSRRAIFGGLSPRNLSSFVDDIYGTEISPKEEARTLARALGYLSRIDQLKALPANRRVLYLPDELVYANGSEKDFRQALVLNARCYALVYTEIDSHIHVSRLEESKLKATAQQWLADLAREIVEGIRKSPSLRDKTNLTLIITSDHGFLDVSEQGQAELEKSLEAFLDLERHGRLAIARASGEQDIASVLETVKGFYGGYSAAWHVIWREQSEQFGLAEGSLSEGEVVAWLMPRLFQYVRKGRGNYVHGGLSMYETIVPVARLVRGEVEVEAPVMTLSGRLTSEEEGELSIAVLNRNDRPLQNAVVDIPELGLRGLSAGDIGPGVMEKLIVLAVPAKSGDIPVQLILYAEVGGVRKQFEQTCAITVQPGRRERMRLSTRRIFDDD
jgi:hypothetical protein